MPQLYPPAAWSELSTVSAQSLSRIDTGMQRWLAAGCALILIFLLNGCISAPTTFAKLGGYHKDITGDLRATADAITASEPKAQWQIPVDTLEVDEMMALPGNRVLVGMLYLSHSFGEPSYGPYRLVDARSGSTLWEYGRKSALQFGYQVVSVDPVILIARADSKNQRVNYTALDPQNGRELWNRELGARHDLVLLAAHGMVALAEAGDTGTTLTVLNLRDGAQRWSVRSANKSAAEPTLLARGDRLILISSDAEAHAVNDGRILWKVDGLGPVAEQSSVMELKDAVALTTADRNLTLLGDDGRRLWQQRLDDEPGILGGDERRIVVQLSATKGAEDRIAAYDRSSGRRLWQRNAGGHLHSPLLAIGDTLAYTTRDSEAKNGRLHYLDITSGTSRHGADVGLDKTRLADQLIPYDKHLVVVHEHGASAYSLNDSKPLWSRTARPGFDSARADWLLEFFIEHNIPKDKSAKKEDLASGMRSMNNYRLQMDLKSSALSYRAGVYQATASTLSSSSSASSMSRYSARQERIAATEYAMGMTNMQNAMERRESMQQLNMALINAGDAIIQAMAREMDEGPRRAESARLPLMQMLAKRTHQRAVQGHYFVHGFRDMGLVDVSGFVLVDMRTGRWTKIATSPAHELYGETGDFAGFMSLLPVLTDDGRHIVLKGIGTAKEKWREVELNATRAVGTSLLGFNIAADALHDANMETQFGGWGYIDRKGNYRIPPRYTAANSFVDGKAAIVNGEKTYFIDTSDKVLFAVSDKAHDIGQYSDGRATAWDKARGDTNRKCGYIDNRGKIVIPLSYNDCKDFSHGLAPVQPDKESGWGFIDSNGRPVTKFEYSCAEPHREGLALINTAGSPQWTCDYAEDGHFGYLNDKGRIAIAPTLWEANSFSEGLAFVQKDKDAQKFGFIDKQGRFVIEAQFDRQTSFSKEPVYFSGGMFAVKSYAKGMMGNSKQTAYIDKQGHTVIAPNTDFECAYDFKEGFARVRKNTFICISDKGDWGYINKQGKYIVEPRLRNAEDFSEGLALVREHGGQYGYIDTSGKLAIAPQFQDARSFSEGLAAVYVTGRQWFRK